MSGFDQNPFSDPADINPFSDPAITQVTNQTTTARNVLDEYSPFQQDTKPKATNPPPVTASAYTSNQPAVMQPYADPPPSYTAVPKLQQTNVNTEELERKQQELEKKAADLQAREEALNRQMGPPANNWPPLPSFIPIQPCFYQDIELEIPLEFQKLVRLMYYYWLFYSAVMFLNFLGALVVLCCGYVTAAAQFGFSILYIVLCIPLSFLCWYRPLYKAFKNDSSFNFMVFFFVFSFQFIWTLLLAIGFPGINSCGLIYALSTIGSNVGLGIFLLIISVCFCVLATGALIMLLKIHKLYRSTGASFAKAQEEFTRGVVSNEHVQNIAVGAATEASRQAMNRPAGQNRF